MAATVGESCSRVFSTWASGTGPTGGRSLASVRPAWSGASVARARWTDSGSISLETAHLNILRTRPIWRLIDLRDQPRAIMARWHSSRLSGPNRVQGVSACSSLTTLSA
jgi:hypothetical protein